MNVTGSPSSAAILTVDIETTEAERKLDGLQTKLTNLGLGVSGTKDSEVIKNLKTQLADLETQLKTLSSTAGKPLAKFVREGDAEEVARYTRSLKTYAETLNSIGQRQVVFSDTVKNTATGVRQLTREFEVSQKVINETTRNYMSHFEMVSRGARASSAQVKSSMEAMTAVRPGQGESLSEMNQRYRQMEQALNAVNAANARWNATSAERTQAAVASLTAQNTELSKLGNQYRQLEIQDSRAIAERMTKQQQVEAQSYAKRRELALKRISERQAAESRYTAWWERELRKREIAEASAASRATVAVAKNRTAVAAGDMGEQLRRVGHQSWRATEGQLALHSALRGVGGAMGALWLTYGRYVTVMAGAMAITKAFKDSIVGGMDADFQAQFVSILQTKGELDLALKNRIRTSLIDIARESIFTVQENAEALKKLSLAGIDATNGLKLLETASNAAIFAQQDMAKTTSQVLDTLNNFGLASNNSLIMERNFNKVADVMAYTAITVNASFTDIAESFKNLTGVAGSFNVTIEESAALLQSLARTGIRGPKGGTYLRNALDDLLGAPISKRAEAKFQELQMPRFDPTMYGQGEFGVAQYFDQLIAKVKEYGFVEQQNIIRAITNQRSRRVIRQELIESYKQENSLLERTQKLAQDAEGSLTKLAEGLTNNAQMQMRYAQAAYNSAVSNAFAGNEDLFINLGKSLQDVFSSENFRDFLAAGTVGLASIGNALVGLIKLVTDFRVPLEYLGRAILMVGGSFAAIKITTWVFSLGAATTGVVALGKAMTALVLAHPMLTGVAIGANLAFMALSKFKELNSSEYKISALKAELADLEAQLNAPRNRISPYVDLSRNDGATKKRIEQLKQELAAFQSSAEGINAARVEYKKQIEHFESEFTRDVERISQLVRQKLGPDATVGDRLALEARATEAALNDIQRLFNQYGQAVSELDGIRKAGVLSEQGRLELESSVATLDMLSRVLGHLEDKAESANKRFATNTITEALKVMGDNTDYVSERLGQLGLSLGHVSDLLNLANQDWEGQNKALRASVRDLELGKSGVHAYTQVMKELAIEAARVALSLALVDSVNISLGEDGMAIAEAKARQLLNTIVELQENIDLSERVHTLEGRGGRGPRSTAVPEVNDVRKAADAEYQQWMEYVNYSKRIVELRRKSARINESEYQDALDAIAAQSIALGVAREKKVQSEIQDQLAKAKDASIKKQLNSRLEQSFAKEEELKLKATLDRSEINEREIERLFKMVGDYSRTLEELGLKQQHVRDEVAQQLALQMQANPIRLAGDMAVLQVARDYRDELEKINRLIAENANNPQELSIHITARENLISDMETQQTLARGVAEYHAETQRSFSHGWEQALIKFNNDSTDYAAKAQEIFTTMSQGIHGAFENYFMNPTKEGFKGLLLAFGQMLQQMIAKAAAAKLTEAIMNKASSSGLLGQVAGMFMSAFGSGTQAPAPVRVATITKLAKGGAFDGTRAFAKGGAFDGTRAFAKGGAFGSGEILTSPTFFKFANGAQFRDGVAGEAGPEAALPLKRMANGKLGVEVDGAGGQTININVNVAAGTPAEVKRAAGAGAREALGFLNKAKRYG